MAIWNAKILIQAVRSGQSDGGNDAVCKNEKGIVRKSEHVEGQ